MKQGLGTSNGANKMKPNLSFFFFASLLFVSLVSARGADKSFGFSMQFENNSLKLVSGHAGYGKSPNLFPPEKEFPYLEVSLADSSGARVKTFRVVDPRLYVAEEFLENGTIIGEAGVDENASFFLVLPFDERAKTLQITEPGKGVILSSDISSAVQKFCAKNPNDEDCAKINAKASWRLLIFALSGIVFISLLLCLYAWKRLSSNKPEKISLPVLGQLEELALQYYSFLKGAQSGLILFSENTLRLPVYSYYAKPLLERRLPLLAATHLLILLLLAILYFAFLA